jgi:hypothetical protein
MFSRYYAAHQVASYQTCRHKARIDHVTDAVAFWARQLRREIPADGTLAAAQAQQRAEQLEQAIEAQRADTKQQRAETEQTTEETLAALRGSHRKRQRSLAEFDHKIDQMLAENWAARVAHRPPVRWLRRRRVGRVVLYWLTMIAGMVALLAFGLALLPVGWLAERATGNAWAGFVAIVLAASLGISVWMYSPWSQTSARRLMAWLQQLEEKA